jgi:hypothetical protein
MMVFFFIPVYGQSDNFIANCKGEQRRRKLSGFKKDGNTYKECIFGSGSSLGWPVSCRDDKSGSPL